MVIRDWVFVGLAVFPMMAHAQPPAGTDKHSPTAEWFQSLRNPITGISCCDRSDGHILADDAWRVMGNHYEVLINNAWTTVPDRVVLSRSDNPTGSAVVFYSRSLDYPTINVSGTDLYCFVRGFEG